MFLSFTMLRQTLSMKIRHATSITQVHKECLNLLKHHGESPNLHILDNKYFDDLRATFSKKEVQFQLVSPHVHRRNAAERVIQTFKHYLISGLCTCDSRYQLGNDT